jgi:hypothetical protein
MRYLFSIFIFVCKCEAFMRPKIERARERERERERVSERANTKGVESERERGLGRKALKVNRSTLDFASQRRRCEKNARADSQYPSSAGACARLRLSPSFFPATLLREFLITWARCRWSSP